MVSVALMMAVAGGGGYFADDILHGAAAAKTAVVARANCNIKGNISIDTGEAIYHVPGQKFYDETIIRPEFGERWFCTEAEARAAGWRKSKR